MTPLNYLQQPDRAPWVQTVDRADFTALIEHYQQLIAPLERGAIVFLAEADPTKFLAAWVVAASNPCCLVIGNPDWQNAEWLQIDRMLQPDLFIGDRNCPINFTHQSSNQFNDPLPAQSILIPTGGTSGQLRFAIHTWETLSAAVFGFQAYFRINPVEIGPVEIDPVESGPINCCCVLPLYHVSGLMQALRSLISGGTIVIHSWKAIVAQDFPAIPERCFISLVPTQLLKLLNQPDNRDRTIDFLKSFTAILLGGAPSWPTLLAAAYGYGLPLAPTYGMTETAGQIATLKPEDFRAGYDATNCGAVLPHATITIVTPESPPESPPESMIEHPSARPIGLIQITARSQMLGYFPPSNDRNITDDLGYFDREGQLHVVGRLSNKIISGGENVYPSEVEAVIRATGLVADVHVYGQPDPVWGEAIVAVIVPAHPSDTAEGQTILQTQLDSHLATQLATYKRPKHWHVCSMLPRNAQGKLSTGLIKSWPTDRRTND
jgi:o-succinylbenzoate---CoA ligase